LKRVLGYAPISNTIQKSQEIYQKAKSSNKVMEYSFGKVEESVQKIIESPIAKYVDTTMNLIENKFSVNEKGCKVLDVVEEKTGKLLESSRDYYNHGKDLVGHRTEQVVDLYNWGKEVYDNQKENLMVKGQEIYENKKDQIITFYSTSMKTLEEKKVELTEEYQHKIGEYKEDIKKKGEEIITTGKEKAVSLKGEYFDKPHKFIVELLHSKYEILKVRYPSMKKVDDIYEVSLNVAEVQKEKAVEIYTKTCSFYIHHKEVVKQKSIDYYVKGTEYIKQGQEYFKNLSGDNISKEEDKSNNQKDFLITMAGRYYDTLKSKLNSLPHIISDRKDEKNLAQ